MYRSVKSMTLDDFADLADLYDGGYCFVKNNKNRNGTSNRDIHKMQHRKIHEMQSNDVQLVNDEYNSHLIQSIKLSQYAISFSLSYEYDNYSAAIYLNPHFTDCLDDDQVSETPLLLETFSSSKSMKQLLSKLIIAQYISCNDIEYILNKMELKNINNKIDREIAATSTYYKRNNLLRHEPMLLIEGFENILKPKYIPDCINMLINQYYGYQSMHDLDYKVVTFQYRRWDCYYHRYEGDNYIARICNFEMRQNNIYLFKIGIIENTPSTSHNQIYGETVDVMIGVTNHHKYFQQIDKNNTSFLQFVDLNKCRDGDIIEVIINLNKESTIYLYKNNRRIELKKKFDTLTKDVYFPFICFKSKTNFSHKILS